MASFWVGRSAGTGGLSSSRVCARLLLLCATIDICAVPPPPPPPHTHMDCSRRAVKVCPFARLQIRTQYACPTAIDLDDAGSVNVAPKRIDASKLHSGPSTDLPVGCIAGDCHSGAGLYRWQSGSEYEGSFSDGQRNGSGTHTWADGKRYTGGWLSGKRHGVGAHSYAVGDRYEGSWELDIKEGTGLYSWVDGSIYTGDFVFNQAHGQGTKQWADGDSYTGVWDDGKQHGYGTLTWANGTRWVGVWDTGKMTNDGMQLCSDTQFTSNSACVSECPPGTSADATNHCLHQTDEL